jgi:hypothetical protein
MENCWGTAIRMALIFIGETRITLRIAARLFKSVWKGAGSNDPPGKLQTTKTRKAGSNKTKFAGHSSPWV